MKNHASATARRIRGCRWGYGESTLSVRRPLPGLVGSSAPGENIDAISDHKGRIEAHAKLADERCTVLPALRSLYPIHESLSARMRYRSQRLHHFFTAHADAVVFYCETFFVSIDGERDPKLRIVRQ